MYFIYNQNTARCNPDSLYFLYIVYETYKIAFRQSIICVKIYKNFLEFYNYKILIRKNMKN